MGWRSGQSYSQDLGDRVLKAVDGGTPVRQAAPTCAVSIAYIYKALIRRRVTGGAGSTSTGGTRAQAVGRRNWRLGAHIRSRPGITLAQAQAWLLTEHGVELSTGAIWNAAQRFGFSLKRSPASCRAGPARCGREAQAVESRAAVS